MSTSSEASDSAAVNVGEKADSPPATARTSPEAPEPWISPAMQATVTLLRRTLTAVFVLWMCSIWLARTLTGSWIPSDVFQYHPLFLTVAFVGCVPEGVYASICVKRCRNMSDRTATVRRHVVCLAVGSFLALAGYAVIFYSKNARGKHHLTTWHGVVGFAAVAAFMLQALIGVGFYFRLTNDGNTLSRLRRAHKNLAVGAMALGVAAMALGMASNFAHKHVASLALRVVFGAAAAALTGVAYLVE